MENSDDEGEDINDAAMLEQDYRQIPELDRYDEQDIDNEEYSLSPSARMAAEQDMRQRDREQRGASRRGPRALRRDGDDIDAEMLRPRRRRREMEAAAGLKSTEVTVALEDLPDGVASRITFKRTS